MNSVPHGKKRINCDYINNCLKNYIGCQITITITWIIPMRIIYVVILWTMVVAFYRAISNFGSDLDSNRAMPTARETSKTQTLRNKGPFCFPHFSQGPLSWRVSNGGFPDLDFFVLFCASLSFFCPFLSLFVLSRFYRDFPDLSGDSPGIFPICPFSLSWPINGTNEEQSRKGPRHNPDLPRKKWEHPGLENPRFSFSQFSCW